MKVKAFPRKLVAALLGGAVILGVIIPLYIVHAERTARWQEQEVRFENGKPPEEGPTVGDKSLFRWVLTSEKALFFKHEKVVEECRAAVRAVGTNAIPIFLEWMRFAPKGPANDLGEKGFRLLGATALPALLESDPLPATVRIRTAYREILDADFDGVVQLYMDARGPDFERLDSFLSYEVAQLHKFGENVSKLLMNSPAPTAEEFQRLIDESFGAGPAVFVSHRFYHCEGHLMRLLGSANKERRYLAANLAGLTGQSCQGLFPILQSLRADSDPKLAAAASRAVERISWAQDRRSEPGFYSGPPSGQPRILKTLF